MEQIRGRKSERQRRHRRLHHKILQKEDARCRGESKTSRRRESRTAAVDRRAMKKQFFDEATVLCSSPEGKLLELSLTLGNILLISDL